MTDSQFPHPEPDERLFGQLQAQAKELDTLYRVEETLGRVDEPMDLVCPKIIEAIPLGWQYPEACVVRISFECKAWTSPNFIETSWGQHAEIALGARVVGAISVFYTKQFPEAEDGPFLSTEKRLLAAIAVRIGQRLAHQQVRDSVVRIGQHAPESDRQEWRIVLQMLDQTDRSLYLRVVRRMLNHLCWSGIKGAESLLERFAADAAQVVDVLRGE